MIILSLGHIITKIQKMPASISKACYTFLLLISVQDSLSVSFTTFLPTMKVFTGIKKVLLGKSQTGEYKL